MKICEVSPTYPKLMSGEVRVEEVNLKNMSDIISPKYQMRLISEVEKTIWAEYSSYKNVMLYIKKWHVVEDNWNNHWENFSIVQQNGKIDLLRTLHNIDGETLLKIAIDLGVDTPDFIPSIPTFRNEIKSEYKTASATFEKAFKQIEIHPEIAVGLANSALESIVKEIFKDKRIKTKPKSRPYTYFIVNSVVTVGLFLNSFYKKKFQKLKLDNKIDNDVPFKIETDGTPLVFSRCSFTFLFFGRPPFFGSISRSRIFSK